VDAFKSKRGSEIARSLGLVFLGTDVEVRGVCSAKSLRPNALTFAKKESILRDIVKSDVRPVAVITSRDCFKRVQTPGAENVGVILSDSPRLSFIKAVDLLLGRQGKTFQKSFVHPTAVIDGDVDMKGPTYISAHVYIGPNTRLGNNVIIHPNVTIYGDTSIGNDVIIHSGTVIGKPGFGYERDENGCWVRFPHIGKVVIEDNVEVGGNVVIDRGALDNTVIGSGARIDNLVHVAHSVRIGKNCIIVACTQTGGSDTFGDNTWIGPNSSLIQGITIGRGCMAGVGSVITRDLPDNTIVAGNPAMQIEEFKKMRAALKSLILGK
jgi:UDP-3-O-[3-hydroxymyristoyl] glucosamine N-acyltransferase